MAGHARHVEGTEPIVLSEYVPDGQSRQVELEFAATVVEYLPDSHATQALAALAAYVPEYVPAAHGVHTCAASYEKYPAVHASTCSVPFSLETETLRYVGRADLFREAIEKS